MIEDLLKGKKVLIIERYSSVYPIIQKYAKKYFDLIFVFTSKTPSLTKKMFLTKWSIKQFRNLYTFIRNYKKLTRYKKLRIELKELIDKINPEITIVTSTDELVIILSDIRHKSNCIKTINKKLMSKKYQAKFHKILNIPIIKNLKKASFPVVIKPEYGRGAKNVFIIRNCHELKEKIAYFKKRGEKFVIQKYIPKNSWVIYNLFIYDNKIVSVIFYNKKSNLREIKNFFEKNIKTFLRKTKVSGFISFQCRIKNNKVYTLELNPRLHHLVPDAHLYFLENYNGNLNTHKEYFLKNCAEIKLVNIPDNILKIKREYEIVKIILNGLLYTMNPFIMVYNSMAIIYMWFYLRFIKKPNN